MGKKQHAKDRLYLTTKEWREEWGGAKSAGNVQLTKLPFHCCAISFTPFEDAVSTGPQVARRRNSARWDARWCQQERVETVDLRFPQICSAFGVAGAVALAFVVCIFRCMLQKKMQKKRRLCSNWSLAVLGQVCTADGSIFDIVNAVPYIQKYHRHPVSGEPLELKDLIQLKFHKNAEGSYHCPVMNKVFTEHTHIVAVKTTGNVYCYKVRRAGDCEAVFRLPRGTELTFLTFARSTKKSRVAYLAHQRIKQCNIVHGHPIRSAENKGTCEALSIHNLSKALFRHCRAAGITSVYSWRAPNSD